MGEKATIMVLKVDLQCPCCYKKVKKIICKFSQIRNQEYNVKANTVTVTVVCCNAEKIRDKLYCKGAKVIKSIEIKEPQKPKVVVNEEPKTQEKPKVDVIKPDTLPNEQEPTSRPSPHEKAMVPCPDGSPTARTCCEPCSEGYGGGPCYHGHGVPPPLNEPTRTLPPPLRNPSAVPCPVRSRPVRTCCGPCSEGYDGGPCYHGYGVPPPPNEPARTPTPPPCIPAVGPPPVKTCCGPCSEGYGGGPCYHGYGVPPPPNEPARTPTPPPCKPAVEPPPVKTCCGPCSEGYGGGPCYHGNGVPPPRQLCSDGCYEYDHSYSYGKPYHITRCDYYFSEENPGACVII